MKYKKGTFVVVPLHALKGADAGLQTIFMWLCFHANQEGVCFPGYDLLLAETGIKSKTTLINKIKELENLGLVIKDSRRTGGHQDSNEYQICLEVLGANAAPSDDQSSNNEPCEDNKQVTNSVPCQSPKNELSQRPNIEPSQGPNFGRPESKFCSPIYDELYPINHKGSTPTQNLETLVEEFKSKYPEQMLKKFLLYWTQTNPGSKKQFWQRQRVFDLPKRLAMWESKDAEWGKTGSGSAGGVVTLHDGTKAIQKFGQWVDAQNTTVVLSLAYYPELTKL